MDYMEYYVKISEAQFWLLSIYKIERC